MNPHDAFSTGEFHRYAVECQRMASLAGRPAVATVRHVDVAKPRRSGVSIVQIWTRHIGALRFQQRPAIGWAHR